MKKTLFLLVLFTLVFFLFQTGCEKRTVKPRETHWDAVKAIISQYPDIFALGSFDTQQDTLFYREITHSDADIEEGWLIEEDSLQPGPFIPYITLIWGDSLKGKFHHRVNGKWYETPFSSVALTKAYLEKWGDNFDPHRGWLLRGFGGTIINSKGTFQSLHVLNITSGGVDVTLNDSTLFRLAHKDSTLIFGKGKEVTLTIHWSGASGFLFLHVKEGSGYRKIPFTHVEGQTFSASWTTTSDQDTAKGYHHIILDWVYKKSVTDTIGYSSKAWGIIYRIE